MASTGVVVLMLLGLAASQDRGLPDGVKDSQKAGQHPPTPAEAHALLRVPEGFRATLFAGEPDVAQPIAIDFDDRGRLWVAECFSYPKWREGQPRDRILIFEDADGDGTFDTRKVFTNRARNLTGMVLGFGGVWTCSTPELLFWPDRDGDDVPDGEPEVVLDGWNDAKVGHNVFNGLAWGPDGWLWGCHGIQDESRVGTPGTPDDKRTKIRCSIWRFHPQRKVFDVVCHGTTNPWGLDFDAHGQAFFSNSVIDHYWHAIPGARFKRMYGEDYNPYTYSLLASPADHLHWPGGKWQASREQTESVAKLGGGHAHCGLMIYQGDNWPEEYRGSAFMGNVHGRRMNRDLPRREGAGYAAAHGKDFLRSDDPWFRIVSIKSGPDGGVFFTDWSDSGECHDHDGVHRRSGRIYKVVHGEARRAEPFDLKKLPHSELVKLQLHSNVWQVRQARRILQERAVAGKDLVKERHGLHEILDADQDVVHKLRAMWVLHAIGGLDRKALLKLMDHGEEHVRVWAIRFLVDAGDPGDDVAAKLAARAGSETSGLVRLTLASALQRLEPVRRWGLAEALLGHGEDAKDRDQPLVIWYGIEPLVPADTARALKLAAASKIPLVRQMIARRAAEKK